MTGFETSSTGTALSRRQALIASAGLPLLVGTTGTAQAAHALQGPGGQPQFHRFVLGDWEVTTLLAGTRLNDDPKGTFGGNVTTEEFEQVAKKGFVSAHEAVNFFTPVLVNTGEQLILFDTGLAPQGVLAALAAAGVAPEAVDVVVLTHMHGDHIGGLTHPDGSATFPNATYVAGQVEFDYWAGAGNPTFEEKVRPNINRMRFVAPGDQVVPGITALEAYGHTPGHLAWVLENNGQKLVLTGDVANHYLFSLGNPGWEVRFDMDKDQAAATRREIFSMIAKERLPFIGYHMPFPALGYVETDGTGFRYVPHSYQLLALPK